MLTTLGDNFLVFFLFYWPQGFHRGESILRCDNLEKNESNFNLYLNSGQTDVTDVAHFFHN